jgi:hypothetical protein
MTEKNGRYWLFTRMRSDIFLKIVVLTIFFSALLAWTIIDPMPDWEKQLQSFKDLGYFALFLSTCLAILIWSNKTYKISYDADSVYMGGVEWRWSKLRFIRVENAMRFDQIAELGAGQGEGILPLAYIAFRREGGDWEEHFFVSRFQLHDDDVRQFAQHMHSNIPEKFPVELIEFMNA